MLRRRKKSASTQVELNLAAMLDMAFQLLAFFILEVRNQPFEQVVAQIGSGLRYDALVRVVDICAAQRLPRSGKCQRLSFIEVADAVR